MPLKDVELEAFRAQNRFRQTTLRGLEVCFTLTFFFFFFFFEIFFVKSLCLIYFFKFDQHEQCQKQDFFTFSNMRVASSKNILENSLREMQDMLQAGANRYAGTLNDFFFFFFFFFFKSLFLDFFHFYLGLCLIFLVYCIKNGLLSNYSFMI